MSRVDTIKQKILQLDGGAFQNLCNEYLIKKYFPDKDVTMTALGSQAGTNKTTKGTPDMYIVEHGKYLFVEYTTQQKSLAKKIEEDIKKCLDISITGIDCQYIRKIIYCHTSSNIEVKDDRYLHAICEEKGIELVLIGIDTLALDLAHEYPAICRDVLNISIDTAQILDYETFIRNYNSNALAAPLDTEFISREEELTAIDAAFAKTNIVILSGAAGIGKTRLALRYMESYVQNSSRQVYCMRSCGVTILDDVKIYLDRPGEYFVYIDDANLITGLEHIVRYVTEEYKNYDLKILMTVRDYACQRVKDIISEIAPCNIIDVKPLTEDILMQFIEAQFPSLMTEAKQYAIQVSQSNTRILFFACKVLEQGTYKEITNVSQIYELYYGKYLRNELHEISPITIKVAGILAFLGKCRIEDIIRDEIVTTMVGVSAEKLEEEIRRLHRLEVINIFENSVITYADECFANYILKSVIFDHRTLNLKTLIKEFFYKQRYRVVESVNMLLQVFHSEDINEQIIAIIKDIWDEWGQTLSFEDFVQYIQSFARLNPTGVLQKANDVIKNTLPVICNQDQFDFKSNNTEYFAEDKHYEDMLNSLGCMAETQYAKVAIDLLIKALVKRNDWHKMIYDVIVGYYGISIASLRRGLEEQIYLIEKLKESSDDWNALPIRLLFLTIAKDFLKIQYSSTKYCGGNTYTHETFQLTALDTVKRYRELIWKLLAELCAKKSDLYSVWNILYDCGRYGPIKKNDVMIYDSAFLLNIIKTNYPSSSLVNCILAGKVVEILKHGVAGIEAELSQYLESEKYRIFTWLRESTDYLVCEDSDTPNLDLEEYINQNGIEALEKIYSVMDELLENENKYKITNGYKLTRHLGISITYCFLQVIEFTNQPLNLLDAYLKKGARYNVNPLKVLGTVFQKESPESIYNTLINYGYDTKMDWLYAYYAILPDQYVNTSELNKVYAFLQWEHDEANRGKYEYLINRNILFLDKFKAIDADVVKKGSLILLGHDKKLANHLHTYYNHMLITDSADSILAIYGQDIDWFVDIYVQVVVKDKYMDYEGKIFEKIYSSYPEIVNQYMQEYLAEEQSLMNTPYTLSNFLKRCTKDSFEDVLIRVYRCICKNESYDEFYYIDLLKKLFFKEKLEYGDENGYTIKDGVDNVIKKLIVSEQDNIRSIQLLFKLIAYIDSCEKKIEYILLLLEYNDDIDTFKNIVLPPMSYGFSYSRVPLLDKCIYYLTCLKNALLDKEYPDHIVYIEKLIDYRKEHIQEVKINEFMNS